MEIFESLTKEIFELAIKKEILSANKKDRNYAGNFFYMYSDSGVDYFKHKLTRRYGFDKESIIEACELK